MPRKKKPEPGPLTQYTVQMIHPSLIKPYPNNPRDNEKAVAKVAASIKKFGFQKPIVVDELGVIIAGHTAHKAAKKLKLKEVPVHVAAGLTVEDAAAYRLADNKVAEAATWDEAMLSQELEGLLLAGYQAEDLQGFGFGESELVDSVATPLMPPEEFPAVDESIHTDHSCPKCGYKWSGGA